MAIWTPTASTKAKTKKLKVEGSRHSYEIEIPAPRVQEAIHNAFLRLQLKAKISGFRPGKAPLDLIKRQFGEHARADAIDELIRQVVPETLKDLDLRPITYPQVGNVRADADRPVTFELHVETAPKFEPKNYKGIAVTKTEYAVKDEEIESRLSQLQEGNARLDKAESDAVGKDHYVIVDFEIFRDGKALENGTGKGELVDMSSDQTLEGLTAGLLGMKRGETKELEVKLEGKPASCKVTVNEIKEKHLPKLDDEFAKDLGFEKLDELKAKLREVVAGENERRSDRELQREIEEKLLEANKFDVPPSLIDQQAEFMMDRLLQRLGGANNKLSEEQDKELREKIRPDAEKSVRLQFLISEIAGRDKIEATEEDFKAELERALADAEDDKQKKDTKSFFEKRKEEILSSLRERKVLQSIRDAAKIKTVKG